jgi:DNA-directed RNA polymerase specialized sigma24 family protein
VKKDWTPSQGAFRRFLNWLDEGVDSDGERYLEMHSRLALYFERKNCISSDLLADETLTRVAQKLEEKGAITDLSPAHYCYITAKFVFLEYLRRAEHGQADLDEFERSGRLRSGLRAPSGGDAALEDKETLDCLELCLNTLESSDRELILEYYQGEQRERIERRSQLAKRLGISLNALSIRACRIRSKLEVCVLTCCKEK